MALISSGVGSGGVDNWYGVVAGIGVILTVIFNPDGIVGPTHLFLEQRRVRGVMARPDGALVPSLRTAIRDARLRAGSRRRRWHRSAAEPGAGRERRGRRDQRSIADREWCARAPVPLLEVRNLTVRYGGVVAVDDVSFCVQEGQIVGLDRAERRGQDDDDRRAVRLPRLRGHRLARRSRRRGLLAAPAGGAGSRPHLPAGRRLRRPHRGGERPGRSAPGDRRRARRAGRGSSTSSD